MSIGLDSLKDPRVVLASDGSLLTAGAFGVLTAVSLVLDSIAGVGVHRSSALAGPARILLTISWLVGIAGVFIGPYVAWRLHGRRAGPPAVLGALVGFPLGGTFVYMFTMSAALITLAVKLVTRSTYAGAVTFLLVICASFLAVVAWLVADAVRDLAPSRREHIRLDVARLLSAASVVAFTAGVIVVTAARSTADPEAIVFLLAAAMVGGVVVETADLSTRVEYARHRSGSRTHSRVTLSEGRESWSKTHGLPSISRPPRRSGVRPAH